MASIQKQVGFSRIGPVAHLSETCPVSESISKVFTALVSSIDQVSLSPSGSSPINPEITTSPPFTPSPISAGLKLSGVTILGGLFLAASISIPSSTPVTSKDIGMASVSERRPSLTATVIVAESGILACPSALRVTTPELTSILKISFETDCKDQVSLSPSGSTAFNTEINLELSLTSR